MSDRVRPPDDISPHEFFTIWAPAAVHGDPKRRKHIDGLEARIQFVLVGDEGGPFHLEIRGGVIRGASGYAESPDVTLETDIATWRDLNSGRVAAPTAVMKRRLKFTGSMFLALKIHFIVS